MAFIAQTIKMPLSCAATPEAFSCTMCHMPATQKTCAMCSSQDKKDTGKQPAPKCVDCPMCTVMVATPQNSFTCVVTYTTNRYAPVCINTPAGFYTPQFKPPCNSLPS